MEIVSNIYQAFTEHLTRLKQVHKGLYHLFVPSCSIETVMSPQGTKMLFHNDTFPLTLMVALLSLVSHAGLLRVIIYYRRSDKSLDELVDNAIKKQGISSV